MGDQIDVDTDAASGVEKLFDNASSRIAGALNVLKEAQQTHEPGIGTSGVGGQIREKYDPMKASINEGAEAGAAGSGATSTGIRTTIDGLAGTEERNRASISP